MAGSTSDEVVVAVEQFLYFHGRHGGGPRGFGIHAWSRGLSQDDRKVLIPMCGFAPGDEVVRPALARRRLGSDRAVVTMKTDLGYDNRYLVHGLVGSMRELDAAAAANVAYDMDLWTRSEDALPTDPDEPLAPVVLPPPKEVAVDRLLHGALLQQLLAVGQIDFGDDYADSIGALQVLTRALMPSACARSECTVGEKVTDLGRGPSRAFARLVIDPMDLDPSLDAAVVDGVLGFVAERARPWHGDLPSYRFAALASGLSAPGRDALDVVTRVRALPASERCAAFSVAAVAVAIVTVLREAPSPQASDCRRMIEEALRQERAREVTGQVDAAREHLLSGAVALAKGSPADAAMLALVWVTLDDRELAVPLVDPPWLRRICLLTTRRGLDLPEAVRLEEALPPTALAWALRMGLSPDRATHEVIHTVAAYGAKATSARLPILIQDGDLRTLVVRSLVGQPNHHASAVDLLVIGGPGLFVELLREGELPPPVARAVLQRIHLGPDRLWPEGTSLAGGILPALEDQGALYELMLAVLAETDESGVRKRLRGDGGRRWHLFGGR